MGAGTPIGASASVRVPATSANVGPGFDCVGLALDLWDEVSVETAPGHGVRIDVTGEGEHTVPRDESHLVVATLRQGLVDLGHPQPDVAVHLTAHNRIPQSRGLGSSAAAVVAGLALAWALARPGEPLDRDVLLTMAAGIEGHPDNAAPAILGGAQLAWVAEDGVHHLPLEVDPSIRMRTYVPDRQVPTALARHVLPESIPRRHAVKQVLAASLFVTALTSSPDHLFEATRDWIHQPYRRSLMPESASLIDDLRGRGVPAVISGAGSTVLAIGTPEQLRGGDDVDVSAFRVTDLTLGGGVELSVPN